MLSLVLGSATHSFELMLSAFILGLALGAFWVRGRADTFARPLRTLGVVQCVMGSLAVATLPLYLASFRWTAALIAMLRQNDAGYHGFVVARYGFCLLVMLPATFCAGITLPLITRTLLAGGVGERAIGAVYGVNTLGSIVGVVLAGLVLMPVLGLKWLLIAGAAVDVGVGAVVLTWDTGHGTRDTGSGERRFPRSFRVPDPESRIPVVLAVIVLVAAALLTNLDRSVLTSGVYRRGYITEPGSMHFDFYRDGRTATVSVRRVASDTNAITTLATNGKPDASMDAEWRRPQPPGAPPLQLRRDIATQVLLPVITLAHAPWAREVAVIGHGSGMTSHFLLGSPAVRRVTTIEIEPEMIAAARAFLPANHRVYDDARSRFVVDDARSVFATSGHRYDLILSEPSNPWVSGVSGLFTEEFYGRVRRQLAPGGVFGQWLHLYEIDDALVTTVLAAIDRVFPSYEVFFTSNVDILVVAGNGARVPAPDWSVVRDAGIAEDLRRVVPIEPGHFEAMRLAGRDVLHRYLASRPAVNSDFHPLLDLGAERTRFLQSSAEGIGGLGEGDLDLVAALAGRRRAPVSAPIAPVPEIPRVAALAVGARVRALRDAPPELLRAAAERLPDDDDARLALYRLGAVLRAVRDGGSPPGDWLLWTHQVADVAHALDGGTAGVADEGFYTTVRAGAAAAHAPPGARAALDFLHGVAAWDWAEAARAGDVLIAERRAGTAWLSTDLLREGAALAHVQLGDPAGARAVFRSLAPFGEAAPLRERLLAARVLELERKR